MRATRRNAQLQQSGRSYAAHYSTRKGFFTRGDELARFFDGTLGFTPNSVLTMLMRDYDRLLAFPETKFAGGDITSTTVADDSQRNGVSQREGHPNEH